MSAVVRAPRRAALADLMTREALSAPIAVDSAASLTRARVELAERIARAYGVERSSVRVPWGYATLWRGGIPICREADDQARHVRADPSAGWSVAISRDIVAAIAGAGVLC